MAVKTEFMNEELQHIFAQYPLGDYIDAKPITEGTIQTNYKVQTTSGQFVFRYYENRTKDSVLFETHLLKFLKKNNYPCPEPCINNAGESVEVYQLKPFVVFTYIDGHHMEEPNERQKGY